MTEQLTYEQVIAEFVRGCGLRRSELKWLCGSDFYQRYPRGLVEPNWIHIDAMNGLPDTVLIQAVPDLLDHLRGAFSPRAGQSYDERFEQMKSVDLLVLDDYGAQHNTDWVTEKFFQLLNHRYNGSLPTVITSNDMALAGVDPRIHSRLSDQELVTLVRMEEARDYRVYGDSDE